MIVQELHRVVVMRIYASHIGVDRMISLVATSRYDHGVDSFEKVNILLHIKISLMWIVAKILIRS